jgi:hypothetical protein
MITATVLFALLLSGEQNLSNDSADSRLSFNFARSIAVDGAGTIHIVWYDTEVHYRRSRDGGRSWETRQKLSRNAPRSEHPAIAGSGTFVYAAWHEIDGHGKPSIQFRRSVNGGASWEEVSPLAGTMAPAAHPSIAAAGMSVHVTWFDSRHGLTEIYTRRSLNRGATWEPEQRISDSESESWVATVEAAGQDVYVGWVDYMDGNEEEYFRASHDGGLTWSPAMRLTADAADSWAPSISIAEATVHFAWFDRRDAGLSDSDVESKLNEALTLVGLPASPTPPRDPATYYLHPFIQRIQEKVQKVSEAAPAWVGRGGDPRELESLLREFHLRMEQWTFGWEIYIKRSDDRGVTFGPDTRLTRAPMPSQRPSVVSAGSDVFVIWFDSRDGNNELYGKCSRDAGRTWGPDVRITSDPSDSLHVSAALAGENLHIVWFDTREGKGEIHYRGLRWPERVRGGRR